MIFFIFSKKNAILLCSFMCLIAIAAHGQNSSYSANTIPIGGVYSTAFGSSALHVNTGNGNTASGFNAMYSNTSGASNTATGRSSMYLNTTGTGNTANGYFALFGNSTGSGNTATGYFTMLTNSTGSNNTAIGYQALYGNTSGHENTAHGYQVLYSNTTGFYNTGVGDGALYSNTTGIENTATGDHALYVTSSGNYNSAYGYAALYHNSTGNGNHAFGHSALSTSTTGSWNTAVGYCALINNQTGSYNTALGYFADVNGGDYTNATAIGYTAMADASNKVRIGNTSVTSIGGQVGWTIFSDARVKKNIKANVPGLAFINLLKPVTYNYDIAKENQMLGQKNDSSNWPGKNDIEKITFSGFLAQDVDSAAQKIGYNFSGIDKTGKIMGLRYNDFVIPVVKAIQEQQKIIEAQQQQIDELKKLITAGPTAAVSSMELNDKSGLALRQNAPNPFTKQTSIGFNIPQNAGSAQLLFYDATGRLISTHTIADRGKGLLTINANDLSNGVYNYSLIVDGKLTETRQLIKQ